MEGGVMRLRNAFLLISIVSPLSWQCLVAESEPLEESVAMEAPYVYSGRLFAASSSTSSQLSGSGVAVGPGVVLTAAHVYWKEAWVDGVLPEGESPWRAYRKWVPAATSVVSESFDNVVSVVSLAGYDDALHEFDQNRQDNTSPFEAFNRDSLLLLFSDDSATPHGSIPVHPRAVESGFLGDKNFYEVVGYPSAKYSGSDSRKWLMHKTTETGSILASRIPSIVYDAAYSFENRLYSGGDSLDSYAGNSGGPVIGRSGEEEPFLVVGVYVGTNALFRAMDEELSTMIDMAANGQFPEATPRIQFSQSELSVSEGDNSITLQVVRAGNTTPPGTGNLQFIETGAGEGVDFDSTFELSWLPDQTDPVEFTLDILDDELREGKETMLIALETQPLLALGYPNVISVTIADNDLIGPLDEWEAVDEVGAVDYSEVVFAQNKFVSVGGTNIIRWSADYQDVDVTDFPGLNRLFQLTYANGLFLACGDGAEIVISEDGETWEIVDVPTAASLFSINFGNGWFVAVGGVDSTNPLSSRAEIWVSRDARSWHQTYDENHDIFDDVEFGNGRFVARAGTDIYVSMDALAWEKVETIGLAGTPSDIEFGAGVFVNAGRMGGIYTSSDGVVWTQVREEDDESWYGVGYRNGYFVSTGMAGKVATSSDGGVTWIDRLPETEENLWHGVAAGGKMVVIGDNALLITSDLPDYFDFIHQPESQTVQLGSMVTLTSGIVSSSNETYAMQWMKNGQPIPGETASAFIMEDATFSDGGTYSIVVSGSSDSHESEPAEIRVETLLAAPTDVTAQTSSSRGMQLSWNDISSLEEAYLVERREVGSDWIEVARQDPDSTNYYDINLQPETEYEYRVSALNGESIESQTINGVTTHSATDLINLSTRGLVGSVNDVMIGGFVIPPGSKMKLLIRGKGPSLTSSEIPNTISDPHIRLIQIGVEDPVDISNSSWLGSLTALEMINLGVQPTDNREAAMIAVLESGAYTVVLSNEIVEPMAVGLIEIFDLSDCDSCRLVNLSTRGPVGPGSELMIGGLVVSGDANKKVLVRAIGPSLPIEAAKLQDPSLTMVSEDSSELVIDDWWKSDNLGIISQNNLLPDNSREVAEVFQIQQGSFTFLVTGSDGGIGNVLLEIFELE